MLSKADPRELRTEMKAKGLQDHVWQVGGQADRQASKAPGHATCVLLRMRALTEYGCWLLTVCVVGVRRPHHHQEGANDRNSQLSRRSPTCLSLGLRSDVLVWLSLCVSGGRQELKSMMVSHTREEHSFNEVRAAEHDRLHAALPRPLTLSLASCACVCAALRLRDPSAAAPLPGKQREAQPGRPLG